MKASVFNEFIDLMQAAFGAEIVKRTLEAEPTVTLGRFGPGGRNQLQNYQQFIARFATELPVAAWRLERALGYHLYINFASDRLRMMQRYHSLFDALCDGTNSLPEMIGRKYFDHSMEVSLISRNELDTVVEFQTAPELGATFAGMIEACVTTFQPDHDTEISDLTIDGTNCRVTISKASPEWLRGFQACPWQPNPLAAAG